MLLRLQRSAESMTGFVRQQEQTANNMANVNTVGYKRDRAFTEALNEYLDAEGAPRSTSALRQWADFSQGELNPTGNPLDFAISGEGLFAVTDEAGNTRYTRAGRFVIDEAGMLRDMNGFAVEGAGGPIQLPLTGEPVVVAKDGSIRVGNQEAGKLQIVRFDAPEMLERLDGTTFAAGGLAPEELDNPAVLQGYVEMSNVNPMSEMTSMITQFRLFEAQQKWITTSDQILNRVTGELGKF